MAYYNNFTSSVVKPWSPTPPPAPHPFAILDTDDRVVTVRNYPAHGKSSRSIVRVPDEQMFRVKPGWFYNREEGIFHQ